MIDREGGRETEIGLNIDFCARGTLVSIAPCNEVIACIRHGGDGARIRPMVDKLRGISGDRTICSCKIVHGVLIDREKGGDTEIGLDIGVRAGSA